MQMYKNSSALNRNTQNEMQIDTVYIVGGEWEERLRWKETVQLSIHINMFTHAAFLWRHHAKVFQRKSASDYYFPLVTILQSAEILEVGKNILSISGSEVALQTFFIFFLKENF